MSLRCNNMASLLFFHVQTSRYSKLEKADILEMTVKHLRSVQRQQLTGEWLLALFFSPVL